MSEMERPQLCARTRFRFPIQHRLSHFLNKQRDTISVRDDVVANAWRKQLVTDDVVDQGTNSRSASRLIVSAVT